MDTQSDSSWSLGARPSIGLRQSLASVSMMHFLRIALPLAILFAFAFVFEYRARVGADEARFLTEETSVIQRGMRRMQLEVETVRSDLFFVSDLVASSIGDESPERITALEQSLLALARRRPDYLQLRFLDSEGHEQLRIENTSSGARVVPEGALQAKGERDYFGEAMRLEAGTAFISRMELNVERGEIQTPHQPVLRLATPIDDEAGTRRGVVVLNAHGDRFLRAFDKSPDKTGVQRMIVDSGGYWLRHRPEVEWGFALEHGGGFQRSFPEVWSQMSADGSGRIESSDGLFFFDTVSLPLDASGAQASEAGPISWVLISWVPREVLDGIILPVATRLLVVAVPSLFVLLAIAWGIAAVLERRRLIDEALRSLDRVRSVMMTAALDAIVVMDESGATLEFNPSAQRIFGYTLDEAIGKPVSDLIIPPAYRDKHRDGLAHYLRTGEGPIIDKHIDQLTGIRKNGEEFPVELTVCTLTAAGQHLFFGFLRDLGEPRGHEDSAGEAASQNE